MIIVTSGDKYLDIDAYACCFAYREMLTFLGKDAIVASNAIINASVIPEFITDRFKIAPISKDEVGNEYVLMDVSNPNFLDKNIPLSKVSLIIDHHTGFEKYWLDKIGNSAKIEFIGAAATLVFEEIEKNNALACIDAELANLMMAAILDNTLNFSATVTSDRDYRAYACLNKISTTKEFDDFYFSSCQREIEKSIFDSIRDDLKYVAEIVNESNLEYIGQLTIWNAENLLKIKTEILQEFGDTSDKLLINVISLKSNKSFLIANSKPIIERIESLYNVSFVDDVAILEKAVLRKEIIKALENH